MRQRSNYLIEQLTDLFKFQDIWISIHTKRPFPAEDTSTRAAPVPHSRRGRCSRGWPPGHGRSGSVGSCWTRRASVILPSPHHPHRCPFCTTVHREVKLSCLRRLGGWIPMACPAANSIALSRGREIAAPGSWMIPGIVNKKKEQEALTQWLRKVASLARPILSLLDLPLKALKHAWRSNKYVSV